MLAEARYVERTKEQDEEFLIAHGEPLLVNGRWLHRTGAQQSRDKSRRMEPPASRRKALELAVSFYKAKISQLKNDYYQSRQAINDQKYLLSHPTRTYNVPQPGAETEKWQKVQKRRIENYRRVLANVQRQLSEVM